jgi:hypothetical protein
MQEWEVVAGKIWGFPKWEWATPLGSSHRDAARSVLFVFAGDMNGDENAQKHKTCACENPCVTVKRWSEDKPPCR